VTVHDNIRIVPPQPEARYTWACFLADLFFWSCAVAWGLFVGAIVVGVLLLAWARWGA
jgi:hypothetical protein